MDGMTINHIVSIDHGSYNIKIVATLFALLQAEAHPTLCLRCADVVQELGVCFSGHHRDNIGITQKQSSPSFLIVCEVPSPLETSAVWSLSLPVPILHQKYLLNPVDKI